MPLWQVWVGGLVAVLVLMTLVWVISVVRRDASIVDRVWGLAFVVLAASYAVLDPAGGPRLGIVLVLVAVWGLRLSIFITARNWGEGEDKRYVRMRDRDPERFAVTSLFRVFWLQAGLAWLISLPLLGALTRGPDTLGVLDVAALLVFLVGFVFEAVGDLQLSRFLADPDNHGKVMDRGLWRYTRHPNYFGDTTVWWGYALFALAAGAWWGVIGSALMTFLIVRVSGVAMTDRGMSSGSSKREGYDEYVRRTNTFFPGPRKPA